MGPRMREDTGRERMGPRMREDTGRERDGSPHARGHGKGREDTGWERVLGNGRLVVGDGSSPPSKPSPVEGEGWGVGVRCVLVGG